MEPEREDGRKRRARERRALAEANILASAQAVISRKGFHAATITDIVLEAGVARGTFYQYFETREAVFRRLIADFVALLNSSVRRITDSAAPIAELQSTVLRVIMELFSHRDLARLLFRDALTPDPILQSLQHELHTHMHSMVCGALRRGQEWGVLRKMEIEDTAWIIIGAIKELLLRQLDHLPSLTAEADAEHDETHKDEIKAMAERASTVLFDAFYSGLAQPQSG